MSWKCNTCKRISKRLQIHWNMDNVGNKVDIQESGCPCGSEDVEFKNTGIDEDEYWEKEWDGWHE